MFHGEFPRAQCNPGGHSRRRTWTPQTTKTHLEIYQARTLEQEYEIKGLRRGRVIFALYLFAVNIKNEKQTVSSHDTHQMVRV